MLTALTQSSLLASMTAESESFLHGQLTSWHLLGCYTSKLDVVKDRMDGCIGVGGVHHVLDIDLTDSTHMRTSTPE
jgi:hypothetical protein